MILVDRKDRQATKKLIQTVNRMVGKKMLAMIDFEELCGTARKNYHFTVEIEGIGQIGIYKVILPRINTFMKSSSSDCGTLKLFRRLNNDDLLYEWIKAREAREVTITVLNKNKTLIIKFESACPLYYKLSDLEDTTIDSLYETLEVGFEDVERKYVDADAGTEPPTTETNKHD